MQTVMTLSEHGVVVQPPLRERVSYPTAMIEGRTAQEIDAKGPAGKEVAELWVNVKRLFDEKTKTAKE